MAMILGVSSKTVKRRIKQMDHVNYIGRGSNLKNAGLIKTVKGFGKGKYQFVRQE